MTVQYPISQLGDCQPNGISDACDLADGLSTDCDGDATPDECEPDTDSDSIPDDCDQPGDFDHDADVDLADYKLFWVCLLLSGPGEPVPFAECREAFDADRDGDTDLEDVADTIGGKSHSQSEPLGQGVGNRRQRQFGNLAC